MEDVRLQKWVAELGLASRREAERWIRAGRFSINGKKIRSLGAKVNPDGDSVTLDGKLLHKSVPPRVYLVLNKPDLCLTSRVSEEGKPTIYDIPAVKRQKMKLNPVGRLDFRTEGLLILSNDGDLSQRLMHPRSRVPRMYAVLLNKPLSDEKEARIRKGLYFEDGPVKGVQLERRKRARMGNTRGQWYRVTVQEGRNRLVRRIFAAVGAQVVRLVRVGLGDLALPTGMKPGEVRELKSRDVTLLKRAAEGKFRKPIVRTVDRPAKAKVSMRPKSRTSGSRQGAPAGKRLTGRRSLQ